MIPRALPTAPAILSELYIEGAITKFYPQYDLTQEGLNKFVKFFSWPGGFPSHVNVSFYREYGCFVGVEELTDSRTFAG